ncbi:MAG: hypothetical protein R6U32_05130 [Candidatus Woesearchaeota archaeon]
MGLCKPLRELTMRLNPGHVPLLEKNELFDNTSPGERYRVSKILGRGYDYHALLESGGETVDVILDKYKPFSDLYRKVRDAQRKGRSVEFEARDAAEIIKNSVAGTPLVQYDTGEIPIEELCRRMNTELSLHSSFYGPHASSNNPQEYRWEMILCP